MESAWDIVERDKPGCDTAEWEEPGCDTAEWEELAFAPVEEPVCNTEEWEEPGCAPEEWEEPGCAPVEREEPGCAPVEREVTGCAPVEREELACGLADTCILASLKRTGVGDGLLRYLLGAASDSVISFIFLRAWLALSTLASISAPPDVSSVFADGRE